MIDASRPTRTLATLLAIVHALRTLQSLAQRLVFLASDADHMDHYVFTVGSGLSGFWNVVSMVLLLGLVLSCDRRWIPGLLFGLWLGMAPLTHLQAWFFDLPNGVIYASWVLFDLAWTGTIVGVAAVQSERPVPVVGLMLLGSVSSALVLGMRMVGIGADPLLLSAFVLSGMLATGGLASLAMSARPSERLHLGWPLILLAVLPFLRIWFSMDARLSMGSYGGMDSWVTTRLVGMDVALFGLLLLGFWGVSQRGVDTVPVLVALVVSALLTVATGVLFWLVASDYRWARDFSGLVVVCGGATALANLIVLYLEVRTLRALAAHLDAPRFVLRADTTLALFGMVLAMTVVVMGLVVVSQGRAPVMGAMAALLSLGLVVVSLAGFAMWAFLCLGLARRLDHAEDGEAPA